MDFLEHEVRVAFLFRHLRGPVDGLRRLAHALALGILDLNAVAGDDSDLAVLQEDDAACIGQQRRNVGGDEVFPRSHAQPPVAARCAATIWRPSPSLETTTIPYTPSTSSSARRTAA